MTTPPKKKLPCGRTSPSGERALNRKLSPEAWVEKLNHYLDERDLNRSKPREQILSVILEKFEHFTIPDLVKEVQRKNPDLGAATIYRSIPVLVEAGVLLESLSDPSRMAIYELNEGDHHDHIVCVDCNAIFEFHDPKIERAQIELVQKLEFKPVSHRHVIYAHCSKLA